MSERRAWCLIIGGCLLAVGSFFALLYFCEPCLEDYRRWAAENPHRFP